MRRTLLALVAISIGPGFLAASSAYEGGPLTVELLGYEAVDGKVYYWQHDGSEAGEPRRTYYFDLKSSTPTVPVHAISLDVPIDSMSTGVGVKRWWPISKRLRPLEELRDFDTRVTVHSDSVGFDKGQQVVHYRLRIDIVANGQQHTLSVDGYCHTTVSLRGVYRIPTRDELLIVLTYVGRAYYCEDVQLPLVLLKAHEAG
jgi:hypothetical protein